MGPTSHMIDISVGASYLFNDSLPLPPSFPSGSSQTGYGYLSNVQHLHDMTCSIQYWLLHSMNQNNIYWTLQEWTYIVYGMLARAATKNSEWIINFVIQYIYINIFQYIAEVWKTGLSCKFS